jgi:hypothetical protein
LKETILSCSKGRRGRLKASRLEFEIVETTSSTSTIQLKPWRICVEVKDEELRQIAVGLEE